MKPHLKMWRGRWLCVYGNFYELASTPAEAYRKIQFSLHTHTGIQP